MKIASYNIMSGGFADYSYALQKLERLQLIIKAVRAFNADYVTLIDTFRWDTEFSEREIAAMFGFGYARCINLEDDRLKKSGHNNGIAVLANVPITRSEVVRIYNRNALKTTVSLNGCDTDMFSVYLDDAAEETRILQIRALLDHCGEKPTVLMGDFNTVDPVERMAVRRNAARIFLKNPVLKIKFWPVILRMLRAGVNPILVQNGFTDAGTRSEATVPTRLLQLSTDVPVIRLDYIWYRGPVRVTDVHVEMNPVTDAASDHYPITGVLSCTVT